MPRAVTVEDIVKTTLENRATLRRVSVYYRTVRYEIRGYGGHITYGSTFPATLQEWDRAVD